jgi:hypothetical protein
MYNFEDSTHLGGYLVGIGKIKANGEMEYKELETPIKNKIVNSGLNHLLMYNGSPSATLNIISGSRPPFIIGGYNNYYGILQFSGIGTNGDETDFFDTGLKSQVGSYVGFSNNDFIRTSNTYQTTKINSFGNISYKVTHKHSQVSETTTIREIGWFGRYGASGSYVYPMFSRVVLPSPIVLNAGEQLITTYQLNVDFSNKEPINIQFFGLKDSNGDTLYASKKLIQYYTLDSNGYATYLSAPRLSYGSDSDSISAYIDGTSYPTSTLFYSLHPVWFNTIDSNSYISSSVVGAYSTVDREHPSNGSQLSTSTNYTLSTSELVYKNLETNVYDYKCMDKKSKYRDVDYVWGIYSPNLGNKPSGYTDIHTITLHGYDYRFGYMNEEGTAWVPQALRKYANQKLTLRYRQRFVTDDIVDFANVVYDGDPVNA